MKIASAIPPISDMRTAPWTLVSILVVPSLVAHWSISIPASPIVFMFCRIIVSSMSAKAFVLIETAVGRSREVVNALKGLQGISSVDAVTGPYDIIAIVKGDTLNDIGDLVTGKIHPISGISRTVTCLAI